MASIFTASTFFLDRLLPVHGMIKKIEGNECLRIVYKKQVSKKSSRGEYPAVKKKLHIEFLRSACIWLVMFTHTATEGFSLYLNEQSSPWFPLYLTVPFFVKTAVPVFFMISGALLLGK